MRIEGRLCVPWLRGVLCTAVCTAFFNVAYAQVVAPQAQSFSPGGAARSGGAFRGGASSTGAFTSGTFGGGVTSSRTFADIMGPGGAAYYGPYGGFSYWNGPAWYYDPWAVPYWGGVTMPPVYYPSELLFGPQANNRFLGVQPTITRSRVSANIRVVDPNANPNINANANFGGAAAGAPAAPVARRSNEESRARARQYIGFGDERFRAQRHNEAYGRYRKAETFAPDLGEVYARQGWALLAMSNYARAAAAFRRAVAVDPALPQSRFRLDELYAGNAQRKEWLLERLAEAADERADDPDLLYLVGVTLYYDGQHQRSRTFFERARELTVGLDTHIAAFLRTLDLAAQQGQRPALEF